MSNRGAVEGVASGRGRAARSIIPIDMAISAAFHKAQAQGQKALILYVTAGDPSLEDLPAILDALTEGGADLIEIGLPFSDPIADGPTIQASTQRALDRGVRPRDVLTLLASKKAEHNWAPLLFMGYYNPVLRMGLSSFAEKAVAAGASGTIISDLTPDCAEDWIAASKQAGLDNIFLVAPTTTDERMTAIANWGSGFVYAVSRTGVTGHASEVPLDVKDLVSRTKAVTPLPVAVGFGISQPEHVAMVCSVADGAVVGSRLVELLATRWNGGAGRAEVVEFVRSLKNAAQ